MKEYSRSQRVSEAIGHELARIIPEKINDPRLGMVTVSGVELTRDMAHAKVFVTVLDPRHAGTDSVDILNRAAGFLRHELARRMLMRTTPQLRFVFDSTVENAANLSALIAAATAADRDHEPE